MKKIITVILILCAIMAFATWQYRLLCLLLAVLLNRSWIKQRWPKACPFVTWGLVIAIFIAIPNYFQHGRSQLIYLNDKGERIGTPLPVYAINALLPEEELMNVGMKLTAVLPPASLSPVFNNLGSRFIRDAQHDFWSGMALTFYAPYNRLPLQGSNPGSFAIAQAMNETLGTDYDGIYVTKPISYDDSKAYPVAFFAHGFLGSWELYQGLLSRLEDCLVVSIGTKDLSGIFGYNDIQRIFTKYLPYLEQEGFHVDKKQLHLMGLSNGGTASNVGLRSFSSKFKTITYISTSCDVTKKVKTKVIMIGGGKDASSSGLPNAAQRLRSCGTNVALLFDQNDNHYILVHQTEEIFNFLNKEINDV
ncbi:MAG: alpha/beta hydrolase [Prevotella sp.]|nr:alpha/beta hydrolase [Prevotella sp.]